MCVAMGEREAVARRNEMKGNEMKGNEMKETRKEEREL